MLSARASRRLILVALMPAVLTFYGCWAEGVMWSPDGRYAAVIGKDGLHLSDARGMLLSPVEPRVYRAVWLHDSRQLMLARERKVSHFSDVASALGPRRTRALLAQANAFRRQIEAGIDFSDVTIDADISTEEFGAIDLYLWEHHREALREKLGDEWDQVERQKVTLQEVVVGRMVGNRLEIGPTVYGDFAAIGEIRPSPADETVAFITEAEPMSGGDALSLVMVPSDGSTSPLTVARHPTAHFDWTPEGHSLVFFDGAEDDWRDTLGALVEAEVSVAGDRTAFQRHILATAIIDRDVRVRCLRDGRILFNARELHVPGISRGARDQLFTLDRTGPTPELAQVIPENQLDRLPKSLAYFEVSPDSTHVLIGGDSGDVLLVGLADGAIQRFAQGFNNDDILPLPAWRGPGEFTYLKRSPLRQELVLRHGQSETILSESWPDALVPGLIQAKPRRSHVPRSPLVSQSSSIALNGEPLLIQSRRVRESLSW